MISMISLYASASYLLCALGHLLVMPSPDEVKWTQDSTTGVLTSERVSPNNIPNRHFSDASRALAGTINQNLGAEVASGSENGVVTVTDADAFKAKYPAAQISQGKAGWAL